MSLTALAITDPFDAAWLFVDTPVECSVCGELCRSFDPDGLPRHPLCEAT